jgi:plastocyanin
MSRSVVACVALVIALGGAGATAALISADASPRQHAVQSQQITKVKRIVISSFTYSPGTLKVAPGAKVKVVNRDASSNDPPTAVA